jgi:DNA-binding transcriptional MerR regulator
LFPTQVLRDVIERKPFGDRPGEPETIARILALRSKGCTLAKIAEALSQENRRPRAGAKRYEKQIVRILIRALSPQERERN